MKKVMIFGTFDILHPGHLDYFRQAKEYGDHLTVVVAHDETVESIKSKQPINKQSKRIAEIKKQEIADEVVAAQAEDDRLQVVREHQPAVICLGYDQREFVDELGKWVQDSSQDIRIVRAKSYKPEIYKSSKIANKKCSI